MRSWPERLVMAGVAAVAVVACYSAGTDDEGARTTGASALPSIPGRACPDGSPLTYQSFGAPLVMSYCTGCHAKGLVGEQRQGAPPGVDLDTLAGIRARLARVYERSADEHTTMPPVGGPTAEQRRLLGDWLACGAPGDEVTFDAKSLPSAGPKTQECADPPITIPAALLPRCSVATWSCLAACTNDEPECNARCIAADKTAPDPTYGLTCSSCIDYQQYKCTDDDGCHPVVAALECCRRDKCPEGSDASCVTTRCGGEAYAYGYCLSEVTSSCGSLVDGPGRSCFPKDVGDAGAGGDAGRDAAQ